jgi:hypothetical protein
MPVSPDAITITLAIATSGRVNPRGLAVAVPPIVPLVTVTASMVEWDRAPLVAVTFTL